MHSFLGPHDILCLRGPDVTQLNLPILHCFHIQILLHYAYLLTSKGFHIILIDRLATIEKVTIEKAGMG